MREPEVQKDVILDKAKVIARKLGKNKTELSDQLCAAYIAVGIAAFIMGLVTIFSFIRYSFFVDKTIIDLSNEWRNFYFYLVSSYAIYEKMITGNKDSIRLPGQWIVYILLTLSIVIPGMYHNGLWVERIPAQLYPCTRDMVCIFIGGVIAKRVGIEALPDILNKALGGIKGDNGQKTKEDKK